MNPRIGYRSSYQKFNRYTFMYSHADNYENWKWLSFDKGLYEAIKNHAKTFSIAGHIDQPIQSNNKSFKKNIETIFGKENYLYKNLDLSENTGILRLVAAYIFGLNDKFYFSGIADEEIYKLFGSDNLGCFWYIFFLRHNSPLDYFYSVINRERINDDCFFINNQRIPCIFYRDYLNNSLSLLSNDNELSLCIENYISKNKIPLFDKKIENIFDNSYIDNLAYKTINK